MQGWLKVPTHYLELIILVFHCLRLGNWLTIVVAFNLRMFLGSLVYKEQSQPKHPGCKKGAAKN